jgi:hypothetical protein
MMVADPMNLICGNTSEGMQRADLPIFVQILAATLPIGSGLWPLFCSGYATSRR